MERAIFGEHYFFHYVLGKEKSKATKARFLQKYNTTGRFRNR